jgi:hypothetical protein
MGTAIARMDAYLVPDADGFTNESLYPWMDEGFTDYASTRAMADNAQFSRLLLSMALTAVILHLAKSGLEEPASTHSDHYNTNYAYSNAAYSKGAVFMAQLGLYREVTASAIRSCWHTIIHGASNIRTRMILSALRKRVSGMELDWYKEYWIYSNQNDRLRSR